MIINNYISGEKLGGYKENYYLHVIFDYGHRICFTYYGGGKIFA